MIYKKNKNLDLITHLTSKRMNMILKTKRNGEEMERRSPEDKNDIEIEKEWIRNGEVFIRVEVETKSKEAWRRNEIEETFTRGTEVEVEVWELRVRWRMSLLLLFFLIFCFVFRLKRRKERENERRTIWTFHFQFCPKNLLFQNKLIYSSLFLAYFWQYPNFHMKSKNNMYIIVVILVYLLISVYQRYVSNIDRLEKNEG